MKSKLVWEKAGERIFVLILDSGDEAFAAIAEFACREKLLGASLTALGAFERATVGWFDIDTKKYRDIRVDQQCELLSAIGDIAETVRFRSWPTTSVKSRNSEGARFGAFATSL